MTNLFIAILCLIAGIGAGFTLGLLAADTIRKGVEKEWKKMFQTPKVDAGITPGAYHKANEGNVNQDGEAGLVMPKTPQRLEWEEQERIRQEALGGK